MPANFIRPTNHLRRYRSKIRFGRPETPPSVERRPNYPVDPEVQLPLPEADPAKPPQSKPSKPSK